jgi:radical SAM/Cys-rich protein
MSRKVIDDILIFLSQNKDLILDITGGAPELNPNFDYFVESARPLVKELIVRTNLTVLLEPGKEYLPRFYKKNRVHLICSLPGYKDQDVDLQRGKEVFNKSIEALKILNRLGYSSEERGLTLDLVYNPTGAQLPPKKDTLEKVYKSHLRGKYGVNFNKLITIINAPIKRFKDYLDLNGEYNKYLNLLKNNFNADVVGNIMCREFLSVGFDGRLYDCDFNQSLAWALKDENGNFLTIDKINAEHLEGRDIMVGEHCLSCTAGYGSSCKGALINSENAKEALDAKESVKEYYGKALKGSGDLKTNACNCAIDAVSKHHRPILNKIHPEILSKFYGCGSPIPLLLQDCTVLDIGCGTGRDSYLASALVGERGLVIGVDMTDEQLDIAKEYRDYQAKAFGFSRPNTEFKKGYIEDLKAMGIKDNSVDVVISNCVINLSPDKRRVFSEIFRVLKPGGELYFSDVFTGRRMPEDLKTDPVLYGECLGGALYIEDFRRILREVGCLDYRIVSKTKITLNNEEIEKKAGMIDFYSMTIRAFKLDLEDICEDYGQVATYIKTIPECRHEFILDDHHAFRAGRPVLVCGNTASMLSETRYAKHFKISGDRKLHYGSFPCGPSLNNTYKGGSSAGSPCCS